MLRGAGAVHVGLLQKTGALSMKAIDQDNLDTAIALGDAVCRALGICCEKRGQVIFEVYQKLEAMKPKQAAPVPGPPDGGPTE